MKYPKEYLDEIKTRLKVSIIFLVYNKHMESYIYEKTQPIPLKFRQLPVHKPTLVFGINPIMLKSKTVPVASKEYHTSFEPIDMSTVPVPQSVM